jgi:glycosyltransferase involved in cell wall biosynthesis
VTASPPVKGNASRIEGAALGKDEGGNNGAPGRLKVLMSAYACEPGKGSEPGVGWNLAKEMSGRHDVWVLTRANNRPAIEAELAERPEPNLRFLYYDLPRWARRWKRGGRGVQAYYYLWQLGATRVARAAHAAIAFDVAHHVTFVRYWAPAAAGVSGIPLIWGPVGGGESMPIAFVRELSLSSKAYECVRWVARWLGEHDPCVRATARRAKVAIATTPETAVRLRRMVRCPVVEMPGVALTPAEFRRPRNRAAGVPVTQNVTMVSAGRLLGWKGYHLAIRAFACASLPDTRFVILGDGPEKRNLEALARALGVQSQVEFAGAVPRQVVLDRLASADIFVHPSLHDSGGWATLEAMASGLPVICLGIGGPAVQVNRDVGRVVAPLDVEQTVNDLSKAMRELASDSDMRTNLGEAASRRVASHFTWEHKVDQLMRVYEQALKSAEIH